MTLITTSGRRVVRSPTSVVATLVCGAANLAFGVWALFAPENFAEFIGFPPYNEHLLHDVGAFQIGIGAGLLLAVVWVDALSVSLVGFIIAGGIHTVNHALDHHLGGHPADPWGLGALTLIAFIGLVAHRRRCAQQR